LKARTGHHSERFEVTGYRIGRMAYLTDFKTIADAEVGKLIGVELLVVNALRFRPHPSHFNVGEALALIARVRSEWCPDTGTIRSPAISSGRATSISCSRMSGAPRYVLLLERHSRSPCARHGPQQAPHKCPRDESPRVILEIESAHVVDTARMILVLVRQQDRIETVYPRTQHLAAEIGPASITKRAPPSVSIIAEVRNRLSRLSVEVQTSQRHPITGTPWEVPEPEGFLFGMINPNF